MAWMLQCVDQWGRIIRLDSLCWHNHILSRRPEFNGHEVACVQRTIESPDFVAFDVDDAHRECYYRPSPLPPPRDRLWVKVVVEFDAFGAGEVVTVYLTDRKKPGERQKWP